LIADCEELHLKPEQSPRYAAEVVRSLKRVFKP
jgi:hypothetical protein